MKTVHYFFKQIGEKATCKDLHVSTRYCTDKEAQENCNELNRLNDGYFYFMEAEDVVGREGVS